MTFSELGLKPELESALAKEKITIPTAVQLAAIPELLAGKDAYISSETGTGKTLAYLLPVFNAVDPSIKNTQAIIIAPTHELAMQVHQQAVSLTQNSGLPVKSMTLIGGAALKRQLENLKKKPQIVIGSPGRINELIQMKKLKVHTVKTIVIDEVDRALDSDSLHPIRSIIKSTLRDRQLVFASATEQTKSAAEALTMAPEMIKIHTGCNQVNESIQHLYFVCEERDKPDMLRKLIHAANPERAIVFVHRNADAQTIAGKLAYHKMAVSDLHGACEKLERKKALEDFRKGTTKILIASDIAARGLDVKGVTHIFNFDIPAQSKAYLHRAGRTGRAGAEGHTISIMTKQQWTGLY